MTEETRPLRHSGFGIASFIISLVMGVADFLLLAAAGIMEVSTPGGIDDKSASAVILGLIMIGGFVLNLAGLAFGIVGLLARDRKKVLAILGLIFNLIILIGMVGIMALGLLMGG
ncbi:MAG: hypothetical protein HZA49_00195 [Planctomycetes bacterium]|nr:hypothetical protein [Planctomycetota bacterium]